MDAAENLVLHAIPYLFLAPTKIILSFYFQINSRVVVFWEEKHKVPFLSPFLSANYINDHKNNFTFLVDG